MVSSRELPPAIADVVEAYVAAQKGEKDDLRVAAISLRKTLKDESEEVKMAVLEALKLPTDLINDVTSRPENPVTWFLERCMEEVVGSVGFSTVLAWGFFWCTFAYAISRIDQRMDIATDGLNWEQVMQVLHNDLGT